MILLNQENQLEFEEISTYPSSTKIIYKERFKNRTQRTFIYNIQKEGIYPLNNKLVTTMKQKTVKTNIQSNNKRPFQEYKIPDNYAIITEWGRGIKHRIVYCQINYIDNKPQFIIKYGLNFENMVLSIKSASHVALLYIQATNPGSKSTISGPLVFGLQLKTVQKVRESYKKPKQIKPANQCTKMTLENRARTLSAKSSLIINNQALQIYHPEDNLALKTLEFSVNEYDFHIKFGLDNKITTKQKLQAVVQAVDQGQISRDAYRKLATIEQLLPREWSISDERNNITKQMNQQIKFNLIDLDKANASNTIYTTEQSDLFDSEIVQEAINTVETGVQRSAKDILLYIIPKLMYKNILQSSDPTIHLRISGDGRNVGRKVKQVMVTIMILNDKLHHHHPDYYYTIILYPGTEKYETLHFILGPFLEELRIFKDEGLMCANILWKFELYFSSDWKFLGICLGINSANSKYFCPWCECSKNQHAELQHNWKITKSMTKLQANFNSYPGHIRPPLFDMIPLNHFVFDTLHLFLRITDRLWILALAEIKEKDLFNDTTRQVIIKEMKRLKIVFNFWEEEESRIWKHTSLSGDDKKKVLNEFNLNLLFRSSRARILRQLWDEFYNLYKAMLNPLTDPQQFKQQAYDWLMLFLKPSQGDPLNNKTFIQGLYMPSQVTPYIHALVYHGWELLKKHSKWGLGSFSCNAVEKKNHIQVSAFFRKTLKNGGHLSKRKSAIQEIIEYENRMLFYTYSDLSEIRKVKKLRIK